MSNKHLSQRYQVVKEDSSPSQNEVKRPKQYVSDEYISWQWIPLEKEMVCFANILLWGLLTIYMIYLSQSINKNIFLNKCGKTYNFIYS